ncbi:response regulator [Roseovarius sp. D0-M9]|uniref:response regulator n=1 Tax=Roseovarius sp. D0-M9 TaxID=3127117 RepID=UPI0030102351
MMTKPIARQALPASTIEPGSKHVLVVEDDDMVREHVVQQVASLGYEVSEAPDGPAGLAIVRESRNIDLMFTDVVMRGGMSGHDLAKAVEELRPELPILFTSGYKESDIVSADRLNQEFELLQKPYRRRELAHRLRKMFGD